MSFFLYLKREGYRPLTIESNFRGLKALAKICDLDNPDSVKDAIASRNVTDSRKETLVVFYGRYAKWADEYRIHLCGYVAGCVDSPLLGALISANPIPDPTKEAKEIHLHGEIPSPVNPPSGCRFHPRCSLKL